MKMKLATYSVGALAFTAISNATPTLPKQVRDAPGSTVSNSRNPLH